jgi:hypothetical protein
MSRQINHEDMQWAIIDDGFPQHILDDSCITTDMNRGIVHDEKFIMEKKVLRY